MQAPYKKLFQQVPQKKLKATNRSVSMTQSYMTTTEHEQMQSTTKNVKDTIFYILEDNVLTQVHKRPLHGYEVESTLDFEEHREVTYKKIGSEEGEEEEHFSKTAPDDKNVWCHECAGCGGWFAPCEHGMDCKSDRMSNPDVKCDCKCPEGCHD